MVTQPELTFDEHTALVVIDVQNDFADPGGGLYVQGGDDVVPVVNDLIRSARTGGALVVYTQDWHPETTPHFEKDGGVWPVHCVADTWGAELHPGLDVVGPVVRKGTGGEDGYSGFTARDVTTGEDRPTDLQDLLAEREVTDVVVVGLAQDVCVKETVLDAVDLGYRTTLPTVATRPVDDEDGRGAIDAMRKAGAQVV
jgi:nicotinamidase/pyrazinamidase